MGNDSLALVKDAYSIFTNGSDVLAAGKNLWLFRADGSLVTKFHSIRPPVKVAFLPNRTAIVDGQGDTAYHSISLERGEILWSSNKKGRRRMESYRFAVSPDGMTVYNVCYLQNGSMRIDRLCPQSKTHETCDITDCLRVTEDIFCDPEGVLCALQTHLIIDPNDPYSQNHPPIRQHGILSIPWENGTPKPYWKRQWQTTAAAYTPARGCDGTHILYEDFSVLNMDSQTVCQLLSPEEIASLPKGGFLWTFEPSGKRLTVCYIASALNIIMDCEKKKIAARYDRLDPSIGYRGCLIGGAFWMGTPGGIVKRPFPNPEPPAQNAERSHKMTGGVL